MATTLAAPSGPETAPSRPSRPIWQSALLLVGLFLYALVFGEMFLRFLHPQALVPRYVTGAPDGIRANMPNVRFRQWTPEVDVTIAYNEVGMRDDRAAPALAKAPGECRVALLGDSYFVGFESDWPQSYAARLETALKARGVDCRVLNFAVSGFGHGEMLIALQSRVRAYQPDLVLVSLQLSDGTDNIRSGLYALTSEGTLVRAGREFLPGVAISDRLNQFALYRWVQENSHLYSAVREWGAVKVKALMLGLQGAVSLESPANAGTPDRQAAVEALMGSRPLNRALIAELGLEIAAMDAKMLLVEIPSAGKRTEFFPVAADLVGEDLLATYPFVSPLGAFEAASGPEVKLYLERGHRHFTGLGNEIAAEVTADAIMDRAMLPQVRR